MTEKAQGFALSLNLANVMNVQITDQLVFYLQFLKYSRNLYLNNYVGILLRIRF